MNRVMVFVDFAVAAFGFVAAGALLARDQTGYGVAAIAGAVIMVAAGISRAYDWGKGAK